MTKTFSLSLLLLFASFAAFGCTPPPGPTPSPSNTSADHADHDHADHDHEHEDHDHEAAPAAEEMKPAADDAAASEKPAEVAATPAKETETAAEAKPEMPEAAPAAKAEVAAQPAAEAKTQVATDAKPPGKVDPQDWTYVRGPEYNGYSRATGLPDDFDPAGGEGSNVKWIAEEFGSRSTPIVMNGKLYTLCAAEQGTKREGERVVCLDAQTGEFLWENRFNVYLSDVPVERVGWSAVVGDPTNGKVYALGVCGHFQCIDAETGETDWVHKLHEEYGLLSTYGGRTNFPIVFEDLVIVSAVVIGWGDMAKPCHRFMAFNKNTGEMVWFNGTRLLPDDTTYSAPVIATLNGQKAMVFGSGDGQFWAFQPRTGKPIWNYAMSMRGINASPIVDGDTVYVGHSEENLGDISSMMGNVAAINGALTGDITGKGLLWQQPEIMMGKSTLLKVNDYVYAFNDAGKIFGFNAKTGESVGKRVAVGRAMRGNPLYADGKIYAFEANGYWAILEPQEDGSLDVLNKGRFDDVEVNGSPICAQGLIYVPTSGGIYCLEDPTLEKGFTGLPPVAPETPVSDNPEIDQLQVTPFEVLLKPGQSQQYEVAAFNKLGEKLDADLSGVTFELTGPGKIDAKGLYTSETSDAHTATTITAKLGETTSTARLRTIPDLPWSFNFDDIALDSTTGVGQPPVTWVGARYRHVVRDVDGSKAMVKISTIPKGTRSQSWMSSPELHDYTIQADVKAQKMDDGLLPDIGLIAQGYQFVLNGNDKTTQVRTWVTQQRMAKSKPFTLEADVWYRLKMQVTNERDTAIVRGKVWKKDEAEPADWTIVGEDTYPNRDGSPGFFGNATNAEIYIDNVSVTPNDKS
ncbi:outer membrane protein assembly factor BamB family protein [Blastopirellula marina]|uniref:Probable serine/threonine protein kinase related protein n=1 Tax=Blastopirellula marina DSM 3645 TaxID=314230 RepID=A3ZRR8_9BACT|nr:PQQ-binding-like beta-propeller repeat protein [Blastopirellula marina]EAQ80837.1 probable serine/threonine protein kinase related protein [Blastopirellula marina DSM 3645]